MGPHLAWGKFAEHDLLLLLEEVYDLKVTATSYEDLKHQGLCAYAKSIGLSLNGVPNPVLKRFPDLHILDSSMFVECKASTKHQARSGALNETTMQYYRQIAPLIESIGHTYHVAIRASGTETRVAEFVEVERRFEAAPRKSKNGSVFRFVDTTGMLTLDEWIASEVALSWPVIEAFVQTTHYNDQPLLEEPEQLDHAELYERILDERQKRLEQLADYLPGHEDTAMPVTREEFDK